MGPVAVAVVLVGACVVIAGWVALGSGPGPQAATSGGKRVRGERSGLWVGGSHRNPGWWVRLRSAVALACLSAALGLALAGAIGLAVVLGYLLLRSSVG